MSEAEELIRARSPFLDRESAVFVELLRFFGSEARIATNLCDLREFLAPKRLYKVVRVSATSFMKCAYALVDDHPECLGALGMLRYYVSPGKIYWQDIEKAENVLSDAFVTDAYDWTPDAFTVFEDPNVQDFSMTAIVAF